MSFVEHDSIEWTDTMWQVWHIVTAKSGGATWTDAELSRACGAREIGQYSGDFEDCKTAEDVRDAVSALYLAGYIVTAFPDPGWKRA